MTVRELYDEISSNEELKKAFLEAAKDGKTPDFLKSHGCEATEEEIAAFLKTRASGELSDEEIDGVAGGCSEDAETMLSIFSVGFGCAAVALDSALNPDGHVGMTQEGDKGRLCNK